MAGPLRGEQVHCARLTADLVRSIRTRHIPMCRKNGASAIARDLGLHQSVVHRAVNRQSWKHVK